MDWEVVAHAGEEQEEGEDGEVTGTITGTITRTITRTGGKKGKKNVYEVKDKEGNSGEGKEY